MVPLRNIPILDVERLDDDHRDLLLYLSQIKEAKELTSKTIETLYKYLSTHVQAEEQLMDEVDYPSKIEHKKSHAYMKKQLQLLVDMAVDHKNEKIPIFVDTVAGIFVSHIMIWDKKLANWLNENRKNQKKV